jgi:sarcosine oxidase gamma subunit
MTALTFHRREARDRLGLKGPRASEWLAAHDIVLPMAANSWTGSPAVHEVAAHDAAAHEVTAHEVAAAHDHAGAPDAALFVARLGTGEFFLEDCAGGTKLRGIEPAPEAYPSGVYPVLREDAAFLLSGKGSLDVLAQVCNVNFAELALDSHPVIMTLMIGVSVIVVPQARLMQRDEGAEPLYRIWCDPTFGAYLGESLGTVVVECGGNYRGVSE